MGQYVQYYWPPTGKTPATEAVARHAIFTFGGARLLNFFCFDLPAKQTEQSCSSSASIAAVLIHSEQLEPRGKSHFAKKDPLPSHHEHDRISNHCIQPHHHVFPQRTVPDPFASLPLHNSPHRKWSPVACFSLLSRDFVS